MRRLGLLAFVVVASTLSPPRPHAGACKAGPVETAPFDLEIGNPAPTPPELVSVILVKPASQIGCQCRPDCVDEIVIEFTLKTTQLRAYILGSGRAFYVQRAENTPDDEARFYLAPGLFLGGPPPSFRVSVVDAEGNLSDHITVDYDKDQRAETR